VLVRGSKARQGTEKKKQYADQHGIPNMNDDVNEINNAKSI